MKFVMTGTDGQLTGTTFDTIDKVLEAAAEIVKDEPDSEVEVMQVVKRVSSTSESWIATGMR